MPPSFTSTYLTLISSIKSFLIFVFLDIRVKLHKGSSVRQTLESVGTSIKVVHHKYGKGKAPTPEELKNYADVTFL